jgi:hypothetical protein
MVASLLLGLVAAFDGSDARLLLAGNGSLCPHPGHETPYRGYATDVVKVVSIRRRR